MSEISGGNELLTGKTAVVTGASRGIGRAIAMSLAAEGADIVATARSTDALEKLAADVGELGRSCTVVTADMANEAEVRRIAEVALDRHASIDILVNNAAVIYPKTNLIDFDFNDWRMIWEVNLVAVAALSQALLPAMISQGSGKIINISSIGAKNPTAGQTAYKPAKAALLSLTSCLAAEVKQHGIDVNCILPGGVDTDGFRSLYGNKDLSGHAPMPVEAIADIAVFLASAKSQAITGSSIDAFGLSNPIFR
jgi:3-oxoacyl-[acyl-carrier protein] reductase